MLAAARVGLALLQQKPKPFCVIDSHAGSGLYRLADARGNEYAAGIGKLWSQRARWPALADYFSTVAQFNPSDSLEQYPGSSLFIQAALRAHDRAVLVELHPEECQTLKRLMQSDRRIAVHCNDAWSALKAFIPPPEQRGLVLIDPPYEQVDEFSRIEAALTEALRHWRNGSYLVWYPIKAYAPIARFQRALARVTQAAKIEAVVLELLTLPLNVENRLNGSGIVAINPPWGLAETLARELPPLATELAGPNGMPSVRVQPLA